MSQSNNDRIEEALAWADRAVVAADSNVAVLAAALREAYAENARLVGMLEEARGWFKGGQSATDRNWVERIDAALAVSPPADEATISARFKATAAALRGESPADEEKNDPVS